MARLVLTARLEQAAHGRPLELATAMRTHPRTAGFDRLSVYLSQSQVVFVIEAPDVESLVRRILNDPVRGSEISPWLPLFDGPLQRTVEVYDSVSVAPDGAG